MRIGIDYTSAVRQGAGIGRYCRELVRALVQLDVHNQYTLFVAGSTGSERSLASTADIGRLDHVRVRSVPIPEKWLVRIWHRLRLPLPVEAFVGKVDIFHSPDFTLPPVLDAKKVLQIHDLSFLRVPEYADPKLGSYLRTVVPRSVQKADLVLADSQHTKRDIIALLGVPTEKIMVILGGVEKRFRSVQQEESLNHVRARYRLPDRYVLALATLEPRKNLVGLIDAYHILLERRDFSHHLVIGGRKGWMYEPIFARVSELGLEEKIHFLGFVADEDLPALYTMADVFAFPSFYEGFGLPILEAMACGTPVVASNASSLPEVVGEAGLMVSPRDKEGLAKALERALFDEELRATLTSRGRDQARRFTWERAAKQLLAAYQHV